MVNDVDDVDDAAGDARFCSVVGIVETQLRQRRLHAVPVAVPRPG